MGGQISKTEYELVGPMLTTDHLRPRILSTSRGQCQLILPEAWMRRLAAWADADGISVSQILLVAYQVLISRYTNDTTIVVALATGKGDASLTDSLFTEASSVSIELEDGLTFRNLVHEVKANAEPESTGLTHVQLHTVGFSPLGANPTPPMCYDIALRLEARSSSVTACFDFSRDLFYDQSINRLRDHYEMLLSALVYDHDHVVGELPLIGQAERQLLLETWNDNADYTQSKTLHQRFEEIVDDDPTAIAIRFIGETITYDELNDRSNRVAHTLIGLGLEPGSRVANLLEDGPDQIAVIIGILKAGGVFVCLDTQQPSHRLKVIIDAAAPAVIVTQATVFEVHQGLLSALHKTDVSLLVLDADSALLEKIAGKTVGSGVYGSQTVQSSPGTNPEISIDPHAQAYIAYTSGSTGLPKGIIQTHRAFCQFIEWQAKEIGIYKHQRFLQWASIGYDASYCEILGTLCFGATLIVSRACDRHDPPQLSNMLRDERVTILQIVPSFARELIETLRTVQPVNQALLSTSTDTGNPESQPGQPLADLRVLMLAGEALSVDLAQAWHSVFPSTKLYNLYGPSESVLAAYNRLESPINGERGVSIGSAIDGRQLLVLDNKQRLCPIGVIGELYILSAYLTEGYLDLPEETALRYVQNPLHVNFPDPAFRTGDSVRWLAEGTLEFFGRDDNLVKLNGMRVELGDIEAVLRQFPGMHDCTVMVREAAKRDKLTAKAYEARSHYLQTPPKQVLVAYVVSDSGQPSLSVVDIRTYMVQRLPKHMVPAQIVKMDHLPLNTNGKVDMRALPEPGNARPALAQAYIRPQEGLETTIAELWSEFLRIDEVGASDGFFDLGGDSLLAMQVLNQVSDLCGKRLLNRHLVENDTVARLATLMTSPDADLQPVRAIQKAPLQDAYPLAVAQQGLWYLWNFDPKSPFYNALGCLHLEGEVNLHVLRRAWDAMISRHVVVSSRFLRRNGIPMQVFDNEHGRVELPLTDLTHLPTIERQPNVAAAAKASAQRPFDLEKDPLLFANLYKTDDHHYELVVTYHEIILDLWGFAVMIRDMCTLYEDFLNDRESTLEPIEVDFRDYTVWESKHIKCELLKGQQQYWRDQLDGELPILELPLDRPRPRTPVHDGSARSVMLDEELSGQLRDLSQKNGTTLFKTLLAAFKLLLHTYSGQDDLIVGTPVANRAHKSIEDLVGWFINMLPIRTRFEQDMTFVDLLRNVHHSVTNAISNSDFPFSWMLVDTDVQRDSSVSPVFQVMFNWQNLPHRTLDSGALEVSSSELDSGYKKYDLALYAQEHVGRIYLHMSYLTDIFESETVERMIENLVVILKNIVANPDARLGEIEVLADTERQLLDAFVETEKNFDNNDCIQHLFEQRVVEYPDRVALIFGDEKISYAELNVRANRLAHALLDAGVAKGDRVAICADRSFETTASVLAVLKVGAAYVALDPSYPGLRLEEILNDTEPTAIMLHESLDCFENFSQPRVYLDQVDQYYANLSIQNLCKDAHTSDALAVIYTSSTSGTAKGILITQNSVLNRLFWMWDEYPFEDDDVALLHKSMSLVAATWELFGALLKGVPTVVLSRDEAVDPARFWEVSVRNKVSHVLASPPVIGGILDQASSRQSPWLDLRFATTSAESIPPEMVRRWHQTFPDVPLLNLYGSTECSSNASVYDTANLPKEAVRVPIGRPLTNVEIQVVGREGQRLPLGAVGEMAVSGACLAQGYFNLPELNVEKFIDGPPRTFLTGDLVRYLRNGNLELVGRRDRQVNVRGFRVNLDDVEHTLVAHTSVVRCAVRLYGVGTPQCQLWAYVVLENAESVSRSGLRDFVRERLPEYMVPAQIVTIDKFPLTRTGKLDYRALPAPHTDREMADIDYVAPRDDLDLQVVKLWEDVLNIDRVGINDDFFDLGGHSLLAVHLLSLLEAEFNKAIPLVSFFQNPTAQGLANLLRKQGQTAISSAVVPLRKTGDRPPFFCICGVLLYRELAESLNDDQPVYTLFIEEELGNMGANGNKVRSEDFPSVEQQASNYVNMIRQVQPTGPYYLGGVSYGGLLAFEIAQLLSASGEHVGLVAMFDTNLRGSDPRSPFRVWLSHTRRALRQRWRNEQAGAETDKMFQLRRKMFNVTGLRYNAKPADFKLVLFRAINRPARAIDPLVGWKPLARAGIDVVDVPGDHVGCLRQPHVSVLGEKLDELLKQNQVADSEIQNAVTGPDRAA